MSGTPPHSTAAATPSSLPAWPAFLSIATAARYLDCSEGLIRDLLKQGLPSITLGRCRRIERAALDAWLARQRGGVQAVDAILAELRGQRR